MGAAALAAEPSDPDILVTLGLYASAAESRDPFARVLGLAGLGRIEEARAQLDRIGVLAESDRMKLARVVAPSDPAWAFALLDEDQVEARTACLLALGRSEEARSALAGMDPTRETLLLSAAAEAGQGRFKQARSNLNRLFASDALEPPLDETDDPLSLGAFNATASGLKQEQPLVSVIIAAKNAAATIETSINSLRRQTWSNLEILVVDDGSSDDTVACVSRLAALDGRVVLLTNDRTPGAYGARNSGLEKAIGDFIAFHDADDWAHPRRIERQVAPLKASAGSLCRYFRVSDDGLIVNPRVFPLLRKNPILLVLRREALMQLGPFEEVRLGGDSEFLARMSDRFGRASVAQVSACLVVARWSASSLMGAPDTGLSREGLARRIGYVEDWRRRHAKTAYPQLAIKVIPSL